MANRYRIGRVFEVEYGHRLMRHPGKCANVHGHTLKIEVVVSGDLNKDGMVMDFGALDAIVKPVVSTLDHALVLAPDDPIGAKISDQKTLIIPGEGDPTSEKLAAWLFEKISEKLMGGAEVEGRGGITYRIPPSIHLESVKVWETSRSWAEFRKEE